MRKGRAKTMVLLSAALGLAALHVQAGEAPVAADDADFVKLGPPKPGEWRHVFQEPAQTFEEYREPHYWGIDSWRWRISVVPFEGETDVLDEKSLQLLRGFLGAYFMTPVALEPVRELPETVRRRASRGFGTQILADDVLRFMARDAVRRLPPGEPWLVYDRGKITLVQPVRELSVAVQQKAMAETIPGRQVVIRTRREELPFTIPIGVASLGIVRTDLYGSLPDGSYLNFVFGMGSGWNVAVISPARYSIRYEGEPEEITLRKRFFKVAAHEVGHVFGVAHCQVYKCCMNGSNSLPEADRRPIHLCPECLLKLQWRLRFGHDRRYGALESVYRRLGWEGEAEFAARRAALEPVRPPPEGEPVPPAPEGMCEQ